ncbi:MAG: cyclic pyranopterin monophosphate synthase MoaC [Cellvibrionales bacterium TMED148]|nr:cyclic pyranopterin monophosphate synthase MoaC [Porticoccaceae bacterium]RPG91332.1 MAG: cyclic pyranopterin monophosphate synthase MoaC [Cellvibrionales bacterium TMED148]
MSQLTHLNAAGEAHMVDVSNKEVTSRIATAQSVVELSQKIVDAIASEKLAKGDLFGAARIAGIQAAKKCSELIPLCHPLPLTKIAVDIELVKESLVIIALCKTNARTGVEMEALSAVSVAALTIYDMCKGLDKAIIIRDIRLLSKTGGKSGDWSSEEIRID